MSTGTVSSTWLATALMVVAIPGLPPAQTSSPQTSATTAVLSAGRAIFWHFCIACHGADAKGRGPAASFLIKDPAATNLRQVPPHGVLPRAEFESILLVLRRSDARDAMPSQMML
jgi:mono/diheme cytochrome c family protein